MKQYICILVVCSFLLCLMGCSGKESPMEKPTAFYYCTDPENYRTIRKTIDFELRETITYSDIQSLLNVYLSGPLSENLISPFPDGCTIESISITDTNAYVCLNSVFSNLSGKQLVVACACFGLTVFEIAECENITFSVSNSLLDGHSEITLNRNDIILEQIHFE